MTDRDLIELIDQAHREPARPVPLQQIREQGRAESRSRRLTSLGGIAAAVMLIAGGGWWTNSVLTDSAPDVANPAPAKVVPWVKTPGKPYRKVVLAPPADARSCGPRDLIVEEVGSDAAMGRVQSSFKFINVSHSACRLSGYPEAVGYEPGLTGTRTEPNWSPDQQVPAAAMVPGGSTSLTLFTANICAAHPAGGGDPVRMSSIDITVLGQTIEAPTADLDFKCGVKFSQFFTEARQNRTLESAPADDPLRQLRATIEPVDFVAGSQATVKIVLTNPTEQEVVLDPCPSYVLHVRWVGGKAQQPRPMDHQLNCRAAPSIPAGQATAFEVPVSVPEQRDIAQAALQWGLSLGGEPGPGARDVAAVRMVKVRH